VVAAERAGAACLTRKEGPKAKEALHFEQFAELPDRTRRLKNPAPAPLTALAASWVVYPDPADAAWRAAENAAQATALATGNDAAGGGGAQLALPIEIVGNPLRVGGLDASHRTPQAVSLAEAAYDQRALPSGHLDVARLAVLADALED